MGRLLASLILLASISTSTAALPSSKTSLTTSVPNANHLFNTIHDSMRQWGSSLHHNGMSFFLATVPAGTQLYHGSGTGDPVTGMEWLALEPEFAMYFAQQSQINNEPGWLHTYIATKDLRLLYLDGLSAARTSNGTLDAQDRILFNDTVFTGPMQDYDRLDGFIRMSAGFEVILCSFERGLEEIRMTKVGSAGDNPGRPGGSSWLKAIASRYGGIGGERVRLNLDRFRTAYDHGLDLFQEDSDTLPRLVHLPSEQLDPIRRDLDHLIMTLDATGPSFNWQAITDMVVERYARELKYLISDQVPTLRQLHEQIERTLSPFIDYSARNIIEELNRCVSQFIPAKAPDVLASQAVRSVTLTICQRLFHTSKETGHKAAIKSLQALIEYLSWAT